MNNLLPKNLLIQWHITERCNLECKHCYQDKKYIPELCFSDLHTILKEFKKLVEYFRFKTGNNKFRVHLNITGGEPLVRKDFFKLLNLIHKYADYFSYGILTNGTLINEKNIKELSSNKPGFIQVSLEGDRATNDQIRGKGNFDKTVNAIKLIQKEKIPVLISFTVNKLNLEKFKEVAHLGKKLGVKKVWVDRMIPYGNAKNIKNYLLDRKETYRFFLDLKKIKKQVESSPFNKTEIAMDRALQFLIDNKKPYRCNAGYSLITVQANGDLVPCRRMPIVIGNIFKKSLKKMYLNSNVLTGLRDIKKCDPRCKKCVYFNLCRGGLRCLAHAIYRNPFKKDPGCWLK